MPKVRSKKSVKKRAVATKETSLESTGGENAAESTANTSKSSSAETTPDSAEVSPTSENLKSDQEIQSVEGAGIDPEESLKIEEPINQVPVIEKKATNHHEEEKPLTEAFGDKEKAGKKLFLLGIIIFTAIIVFTGIFVTNWLKNTANEETAEEIPVEPSPEITATPPFLDKSTLTFEVLNGSGVAGAAKKYAEKVSSFGYRILKIDNADKSDYKTTQLFVAEDHIDRAGPILTDLSISSVSGSLTDSTASARIIIGRE